MKAIQLFQLFILALVICTQALSAAPASASPAPSPLARQTVSNYQAPCKTGTRAGVTTWHDNGSLDRYAYDWICDGSSDVYAPHSGVIKYTNYYSDITHGMIMIYDPDNDACISMLHLNSNFSVSKGNQVSSDTKLGSYTGSEGHTHIGVNPGQCASYNHANELPILFKEIGSVLPQKITIDGTTGGSDGARVWVTTGSGGVPSPRIAFSANANAKLFFDQGDQRANLQVCADNLRGQQLFVRFWRDGRWFNPRSETAADNCHTFWDLDEAGSVLTDRPYRAWVSMGNAPDTNWPVGCFETSAHEGLCTQAQFPSESIDPSGPIAPVETAFANGISTPTIDINAVNLKVCGDNVNGKTVYWQMWRDDRVWNGQGVANDRCIDLTNLDGDGPVLTDVTYFTVTSLNPIPADSAKQQRTACAGTTGGKQLCDAVRYTAASTCTAGKNVDDAFRGDVINNLNGQSDYSIQNNEYAIQALKIWQGYENTNACWNPLATTWGRPGSSDFNSVGVKNYANRDDGIAATANTLGTKNIGNYKSIRQMFALQGFDEGGLRANLTVYSGNGGYTDNLINDWRNLYNQYAAQPTPTVPAPVLPTPTVPAPVQPTPTAIATAQPTPTLPAPIANPTQSSQSSSSARFEPASANVGQTVSALFSFDPAGQPVKGLEFACAFDANVLKYIRVVPASAFGSRPVLVPVRSNDNTFTWSIAGSNGQMMSVKSTVFNVSFNTLAAANTSLTCTVRRLTQADELKTVPFTPANLNITPAIPTVPTATAALPVITPQPPIGGTQPFSVSGQVVLTNKANTSATLKILDSSGKMLTSMHPDADGKFSIQLQPGTYTFSMSAPGFLSASRKDTLSAATNLPSVQLAAGDIDQNNIIDLLDIVTLGNIYGKSPLPLATADLTGDHVVDLRDLVILAVNFLKTGPTQWE